MQSINLQRHVFSEEVYESMYRVLCEYYAGAISFLDLLVAWETILQISSLKKEPDLE